MRYDLFQVSTFALRQILLTMGRKGKITPRAKEPVKIRFKQLANENKSMYLDFYRDGKRAYEFLRLYIIPETTPADKEANFQTMRLANAIKAQKILTLQNAAHGFSVSGWHSKTNLLAYVEHMAKRNLEKSERKVGTGIGYMALHHHLKQYSGEKTTFRQIDKTYCMGFIAYLRTTKTKWHDRSLNENSQHRYMKMFESVLNAAITDEIINLNPFKQLKPECKPKKRPAEIRYLTIDEVRILEKTPYLPYPDIKNAFLFSCFSGLRYSDVISLTWNKLQKDNERNPVVIYIQKKTRKQEYLPLSKEAVKFLPNKGTVSDSGHVFKMPSAWYVNSHIKRWACMAGIGKRITFHAARHTYATLLLSLGASIETVSKSLGHSTISTTQIYAKVMDKSIRAAVSMLDGLTD